MRRLLCALLMVGMGIGWASADGPTTRKRIASPDSPGVPYALPSSEAPIVNWTGLYAGGAIGYHTDDAWAVGGYVGYNLQYQSRLVLGLEADIARQWGAELDVHCGRADPSWHGSLRARAGYAIGNLLPYVTAGWGWKRFDVETPGAASTEVANGFVYGAGVEARLTKTLSARLEFARWETGDIDVGPQSVSTTDNVIRLGATFHF